ncbi:MAG: carbamoyl-phosphate synthase large subunit, partial [Terriglobales bacterium]
KWQFEKFPGAETVLGPQMHSVGEVMAIGRSFKEALFKGVRSLETGKKAGHITIDPALLTQRLVSPHPDRLSYVRYALGEGGMSLAQVAEWTGMDPWFLHQIQDVSHLEQEAAAGGSLAALSPALLRTAKRSGLSDARLGELTGATAADVATRRKELGLLPVYKRVDTCAAEFASSTPYFYSTYEEEDEAAPTARRKIAILGSGPNRIGQGIEFDYCCCHAAYALRERGFETIMINCNPETVSTDYDTSDRLYFEPLTFEDVARVLESEAATGELAGVIVQFGGQTPLNLALPLEKAGFKILGTSPHSIDLAEDRKRFGALLRRLELRQPENGTATSVAQALRVAGRIGYPVLVRPSYVLGGRAMAIVYDDAMLREYMALATEYSSNRPILIDRFLEDAIEVDVDAIADGRDVVLGGIMEHIEEAGIHSGDSSCVLPPYSLAPALQQELQTATIRLAQALHVRGLMNVQYAITHDENGGASVYVLEVNPRASRTVPFVSKATGVPLAKLAATVMSGAARLRDLLPPEVLAAQRLPSGAHTCVKSPVFPWNKFSGADPVLGPEMHSTGEVMGIATSMGAAFAKAQLAAGQALPEKGTVFFKLRDRDKVRGVSLARRCLELGFDLLATRGTAAAFAAAGLPVRPVFKISEGRPNFLDLLKGGTVTLVVNTPAGRQQFFEEKEIRRTAVQRRIPIVTTLAAAHAAIEAIAARVGAHPSVTVLQEMHESQVRPAAR